MRKKNLEYIDDLHLTIYKGEPVPSVTQIIQAVCPSDYDSVSEDILKIAAHRGQRIHTATEAIDKGEEHELSADIAPYLLAYKSYGVFDWDETEFFILTRGKHRYCGRGDRKKNGSPYDIKTYATLNPDMIEKIGLQLVAYVPTAKIGYIIHLKKDGRYKEVPVELNRSDWNDVLKVFYRWHYKKWAKEMMKKYENLISKEII